MACKEVIAKDKNSMRKTPNTKKASSKKHSCRKAKKVIKKPERQKITTRNPKALNFKCKHCDSSFSRAVSLGGHVSKMHAGMQSGYQHKMMVFKARTKQREYLKLAKQWFKTNIGLDPKDHRILLTNIKKLLMQGKEVEVEKIKAKFQPKSHK